MLDKYASFINKSWHDLLTQMSTEKHVFLNDIERVEQKETVVNPKAKKIKYSLDSYADTKECLGVSKDILPENMVIDLHKELLYGHEPLDWENIKQTIDTMSNYLIYPTATLDINMPKRKNLINILVLGAGPTGLFIANYLTSVINKPWANVLVIDNRIHEDTPYRLPYFRNRQFSVDASLFTAFFPRIMTIDDIVGKPIAIKYLEYMLMVILYGNRVPVCYSKSIYDDKSLEKFVKAKSIDIVYDCTRGRLKQQYFPNVLPMFPENMILSDQLFEVKKHGNEYQLYRKDGLTKRFYLSIETYLDGKYHATSDVPPEIQYLDDLNTLRVLHGKCFRIKSDKLIAFTEIFDNLRDLELSKAIQASFIANKDLDIKVSIVEAYLMHKIQVAKVVDSFLFVSAGDSAFTSHFYIGAGLNRSLRHLISVLWFQQILYQ